MRNLKNSGLFLKRVAYTILLVVEGVSMPHVAPIVRKSIDAWPVAESGLPARVVKSLLTAGITTVGRLRTQSDRDLLALRGLGRISLGHLRPFFKLCGRIERGKRLFNSIRELLRFFLNASEMKVITARYGFELEEPKASRNCATLEAIGARVYKTRERVRQVKETAMQKLRNRPAAVCLEPFYTFFIQVLEARGKFATCADIWSLGNKRLADGYNLCGILTLLSDLHPERIAFYGNFFSALSEQTIRAIASQAIGFLDRAAKPISLDDLLKSEAISFPSPAAQKKQALSYILEQCPLVAATLDRRYFTYERGVHAFLAEVLQDLKRPVHYKVATNAFNDRLKSPSRKGAGFVLEALNTAPLCERVDGGVYDLKAG